MKKMAESARKREITELELCALGIVWLRGPCSAYTVRHEFADSMSSHWSSSTGSVYPVIKRLLAGRLIAAKSGARDGRGKRNLTVTPKGANALKACVGKLPDWTGKATLDPIRSRMNFLAVLKNKKAQLAFVARAERNTALQIGIVKQTLAKEPLPLVEHLAILGCVYELDGRLRWLRAVRKAISSESAR